MNVEDSRTAANRSRSSSISGAYCALTSTSGIFGTAAQSSGPPMTDYCGNDDQHDRRDDDVFCVAELVVEVLPLRAKSPADAGEREAPDRRAGDREQRVAPQRHPHYARRDRDERANDRRDTADRDREVAEAVEPALRAVEVLRRQVQEPAAALDQRPPAVEADPPAENRADDVARGARRRHRDVGPGVRLDGLAEEHHLLARECSSG